MLVIGEDQFAQLSTKSKELLAERITRRLIQLRPQLGSFKDLIDFVRVFVGYAQDFGFCEFAETLLLADFFVDYGVEFGFTDETRWGGAILSDHSLSTWERLDALLAAENGERDSLESNQQKEEPASQREGL